MAINFFPEDVLLEILARLRVKSLLRFQSVAKSWRDILKEPTFITKHHLTQAALNNHNCNLIKACIFESKKFGLLIEDEQEIKCTALEAPFLRDADVMNLQVAGPCNGLVVISNSYEELFLWNPATRESKAFPHTSLLSSLSNQSPWCSGIGFGIDPITKDYKVVRIWTYSRSENDDDCIEKAEVFNVSANPCRPKGKLWKIIDAAPPISLHLNSGQAYLNGKFYWCTEWQGNQEVRPYRIMWFDMGAEVFGRIELPNLCSVIGWNRLGVFEESLAMVRHSYAIEDGDMYEIWIMDESDGLSWTTYATVGPFMEYEEVPLGFWNNEKLVVVDDENAYSYDIKTHKRKKIMQGVVMYMDPPLPIYNESLVSITGEEWLWDKEIMTDPYLEYCRGRD